MAMGVVNAYGRTRSNWRQHNSRMINHLVAEAASWLLNRARLNQGNKVEGAVDEREQVIAFTRRKMAGATFDDVDPGNPI